VQVYFHAGKLVCHPCMYKACADCDGRACRCDHHYGMTPKALTDEHMQRLKSMCSPCAWGRHQACLGVRHDGGVCACACLYSVERLQVAARQRRDSKEFWANQMTRNRNRRATNYGYKPLSRWKPKTGPVELTRHTFPETADNA
jgi:hypothetical protein